jgi:hypothetical protein
LYQNAYYFSKNFPGVIPRTPIKRVGEEDRRKKGNREEAVGRAGKRGRVKGQERGNGKGDACLLSF